MSSERLRIALTKGRLQDKSVEMFEAMGLDCSPIKNPGRRLVHSIPNYPLDAVLAKAIEVLTHEGSGHTFAMHCEDKAVVKKFALQIPVSRFLVNTPAALGGIGESTALFPALTLGCGAVGGSSSSNNISPLDLINIRRVAWDCKAQTKPTPQPDDRLVELITAKILEKLR